MNLIRILPAVVILSLSLFPMRSLTVDVYLEDVKPDQIKTVYVCPRSLETRSGRIRIVPPGKVYQTSPENKVLNFELKRNNSRVCEEPGSIYSYFLSVKSLYVTDGSPAFTLSIDGRTIDWQNIPAEVGSYNFYPESQVQYLSPRTERPNITLQLELYKSSYDDSNAVQIDYVLVAYPPPRQPKDGLILCDTLNGYIPLDAYCQPFTTESVSCPQTCASLSFLDAPVDHFNTDGLSFWNCGIQRNGTICGDPTGLIDREDPRWKLSSSSVWLIAIIAAAFFCLVPLGVVCFAYHRSRK